jgi:hypothetical protein
MRRRDWIALAMLGIALAISVGFFFGATEDSPRVTVIATSGPGATPGGQATNILPAPTSAWTAQFTSTANPTTNVVTTTLPVLDLNFNGAPFAGLTDNAWSVDVAAGFVLTPGHYTFGVQHDGELHVYIDNQEVASDMDPAAPRTVDVGFDSKGGVSVIRIVAMDKGGVFTLKFVTPDPHSLT